MGGVDPHAVSLRYVPAPARAGEAISVRGRRVGLPGVLSDLGRSGRWTSVPGEAAEDGFAWDAGDERTRWWYPQGISSSADGLGGDGTFEGRSVLLTSWYGHGATGWLALGSRLSVIDLDDEEAPRYAHVQLVNPSTRRWLVWWLRRVRIHAGGLAWYGDHLFVAASGGGIRVYRLSSIVRRRSRRRRFVLPQVAMYRAESGIGAWPLTYSFLSVQRTPDGDFLVAGEYGRKDARSHRLVRFALDRDTELLATDADGIARPDDTALLGVPRMQGAAVVGDAWAITASNGEGNAGDLWVGVPHAEHRDLHRHRGVLPTGPEDVTWWPHTTRLWTLTEWPGRRWVFPIDVGRWLSP